MLCLEYTSGGYDKFLKIEAETSPWKKVKMHHFDQLSPFEI